MHTAYACARFSAQHLKLADRAPIGMGNRRYVFAHPTHPDLCIKLARTRHIRYLNGAIAHLQHNTGVLAE